MLSKWWLHAFFVLPYIGAMSIRFVNVDRDQRLLLPPVLREWIPEDDLVDLRGHENVNGEWQLVALAYNFKRLRSE